MGLVRETSSRFWDRDKKKRPIFYETGAIYRVYTLWVMQVQSTDEDASTGSSASCKSLLVYVLQVIRISLVLYINVVFDKSWER